jgi:hypothetical protein
LHVRDQVCGRCEQVLEQPCELCAQGRLGQALQGRVAALAQRHPLQLLRHHRWPPIGREFVIYLGRAKVVRAFFRVLGTPHVQPWRLIGQAVDHCHIAVVTAEKSEQPFGLPQGDAKLGLCGCCAGRLRCMFLGRERDANSVGEGGLDLRRFRKRDQFIKDAGRLRCGGGESAFGTSRSKLRLKLRVRANVELF